MRRVGRRGAFTGLAAIGAVAVLALTRSGGNEPPGNPAAFCRGLGRLNELVSKAATGPEEIADLPAARALADDIARVAEGLREDAPEAIAADARRLAGVTRDLARELRDFYQAIVDDPARANDAAFLASFQPITEERRRQLDDAGAAVRPWVQEQCVPTEGFEPPLTAP